MKFNKTAACRSALMFKALSHPIRVWIVKQLATQDHCVGEFVQSVNVEFATISRHLAKLKKAGLITSRKKGREIWYGLNKPAISQLFANL